MKCKVGDVALCIVGVHAGKRFEVMGAPLAAGGVFPDGNIYTSRVPSAHWIIKSLSGPLDMLDVNGSLISSLYGAGADAALMPLRPPKITETETTDELEGVL